MKAVHFGAGNIGRGFIGETLAANNFTIQFVDIASNIIDALNQKHGYTIEFASPEQKRVQVSNVSGINNKDHPEEVVQAVAKTDLITTAIGPNILKIIAPLIADGLKERKNQDNKNKLDIIACENMIGGSQHLKAEVYKHLDNKSKTFVDTYIGFPNAAVDRIVPLQKHQDPLYVSVEPFKEWIVDKTQMVNPSLKLKGVDYVPDLEPYIERKLFSVNTGHATVAYTGKALGYSTIGDAIKDKKVLDQLKEVLKETGDLLIHKWHFDKSSHKKYQTTIINRFQNPYISDVISRVGRTPIRKLGYNERFIRPIRELKKLGLNYSKLLQTVSFIYQFNVSSDKESQKLQNIIKDKFAEIVVQTTQLKDKDLIDKISTKLLKHFDQKING